MNVSPNKSTGGIVVGIDPGLAKAGMAVLNCNGHHMRVVEATLIETKKASKKELRATRVSVDDQRRMREIWDRVGAVMDHYRPIAIGIESYAPIPGQQGGGSWKTASVTHLLVGLCWAKGYQPVMARPGDLRRMYLGSAKGSKLEIESALMQRVDSAQSALDGIAKSKREHVADAIGYATVAYEEMKRLRAYMGID